MSLQIRRPIFPFNGEIGKNLIIRFLLLSVLFKSADTKLSWDRSHEYRCHGWKFDLRENLGLSL